MAATEPRGVLVVREDGATTVPNAAPVPPGLIDAIERLFNALGIPTREEREQQQEEET